MKARWGSISLIFLVLALSSVVSSTRDSLVSVHFPVTIPVAPAGDALGFARTSFIDLGVYWIFYSNSSGYVNCLSSSDGVTWSSPVGITPVVIGAENFNLWNNATSHTIWYVKADNAQEFLWRYGIYSSFGCPRLSWSIPETAVPTIHTYSWNPSIAATSDSNVMVSLVTENDTFTRGGTLGNSSYPREGYTETWKWNGDAWTNVLVVYWGGSSTGVAHFGQPHIIPSTAVRGHWAVFYTVSNTGAPNYGVLNYTIDNGATWSGTSKLVQQYNGFASTIIIGTTMYIAGLACCTGVNVKKLYFTTYAIGDTNPTIDTPISQGTYDGVAMTTDGQNMFLFVSTNQTIRFFVSSDLGASWSGPTSAGSHIIAAENYTSSYNAIRVPQTVDKNSLILVTWMSGTLSFPKLEAALVTP